MGPRSPLGRWYESLAGHGLAFTFEGLVIASVLYSLPFAVQPMAAAFGSVDRKYIEASWMLGRVESWNFFSRHHSAILGRIDDRRRFELRAHLRRIRSCAHGRREHSGRDADALD